MLSEWTAECSLDAPTLIGTNPEPSTAPMPTLYRGRSYTVPVHRMNGISQGAYYGDDVQVSTNFPIIKEAGVEDRVIVTSFDLRKLREAKRRHPGLALGFCFDDTMLNFASGILDRLPPIKARLGFHDHHPNHHARRWLNRILDSHVIARFLDTRVIGADHTLVGEDTVAMLHKRGVAIGTHTLFPIGSSTGKPLAASASTEREVARLVELGVDWIESDDPERLLAVMERVSR